MNWHVHRSGSAIMSAGVFAQPPAIAVANAAGLAFIPLYQIFDKKILRTSPRS